VLIKPVSKSDNMLNVPVPTLYASITMPMATAPRIVSPNGTIGT
jgi:hypothetical protein